MDEDYVPPPRWNPPRSTPEASEQGERCYETDMGPVWQRTAKRVEVRPMVGETKAQSGLVKVSRIARAQFPWSGWRSEGSIGKTT